MTPITDDDVIAYCRCNLWHLRRMRRLLGPGPYRRQRDQTLDWLTRFRLRPIQRRSETR